MVNTPTKKRSNSVAAADHSSEEAEELTRKAGTRRHSLAVPEVHARGLYDPENIASRSPSHYVVEGPITTVGFRYVAFQGKSESPEISIVVDPPPQPEVKTVASNVAPPYDPTKSLSSVLYKFPRSIPSYKPFWPNYPNLSGPQARHGSMMGSKVAQAPTMHGGVIGSKVAKAPSTGLASSRERRESTTRQLAGFMADENLAEALVPDPRSRWPARRTFPVRGKPKDAKDEPKEESKKDEKQD